jgi:hypothetical protein
MCDQIKSFKPKGTFCSFQKFFLIASSGRQLAGRVVFFVIFLVGVMQ